MLDKEINKNEEIQTVESLPIEIKDGSTFFINQSNPNTYTHSFFKYPCKFIPEIPRWAIKKYLIGKEAPRVLDPFSGSGTTALESLIAGHEAVYTEIDSLAKLITKVKTTRLTDRQIEIAKNEFDRLNSIIISQDVIPTIPVMNNIEHWFSIENIRILGQISTLISKIDDLDVRDFYQICFASIIKKSSNCDDFSPKPYVSTKIKKKPVNPIKEFNAVFNRYFASMVKFSQLQIKKEARLLNGDALNIQCDVEVDLVITSPPYINAFDYGRTLRLENLWLGLMSETEIRKLKQHYVGTEIVQKKHEQQYSDVLKNSSLLKRNFKEVYDIDQRRAIVLLKFFYDMSRNLDEVRKVLRAGGRYVIVIGNSKIRGVTIESWRILSELALEKGMTQEVYFNYAIQNPYIRIPRQNRGGLISQDTVLVLRK